MTDAATLRRRGLFRFRDGDRDRFSDTLAVQFRLQEACPGRDIGRLYALLDAIAPPPPAEGAADGPAAAIDPLAAMVELGPIVGAGFGLSDLDEATGAGLSIQERIELVTAYFAALAPAPGEADADEADDADEAEVDAVDPAPDPTA